MDDTTANAASPPASEHRAPPPPEPGNAPESGTVPGTQAPAKKLTPEEQMTLYEDDLKENDWGHQPC